MVRWDVQRPSLEEAQALLASATAQGQGQEAQALLAYIGDQDEASRTMQDTLRVLARADEALSSPPPTVPTTPATSAAEASLRSAVEGKTTADSTLAGLAARAARPEPGFQASAEPPLQVDPALAAAALAAARPKKRMPTILLVALAALAASAALTFWQRLPEETVRQTKDAPVVAAAEPSPASSPAGGETGLAPAPAPAPAPGVGSAAGPAVEPTVASPQASPPAPPPVPPKGLVGPVPVPEDADPAARLAAKAAPAAAPTPLKPPAAAPSPPPEAPASTKGGRPAPANSPTEIKTIPAGFYVQHMSSGEREVVETFWRRNPSLRQARLVELTRIGAEGPNFVLLSGPFSTIAQARRFMNRPGLPKDMWVREASKIRPLLPTVR
jgi:hypothetical protein